MERWDQLCETVGVAPVGNLLFVPDTADLATGPFLTSSDQLEGFFDRHIEEMGNCVLSSGDLFVLAIDEGRLILWHHSELCLVL